jgi:hypothetical protein
MARIRTARIAAAAASLPLAIALLGGVAQAVGFDNGAVADDGSNATVNQQIAVGDGASNQANHASVFGHGLTWIDQSNENVTVHFTQLW